MGNHISIHHHHISLHHHHRRNKKHKSSQSNSYSYINGRKYFNTKDSIYPFPVDGEECDRSQTQHFLNHHIWGENFSSPVGQILEKGGKVLDVGCGPGAWLMEMATSHQRSEFVGVDMIPIFPTEIKPCNLEFMQCNILNGLPEIVRVTKLNGWVELMEVEPRTHLGNLLQNHSSNQLTDFHKETRKLLHYERVENMDSKKCYINKAGKLSKENITLFYHTISPIILPILGITQKEYDEIIKTTKVEFEKNKCYNNVYRFYARKISKKK